MATDRIVNRNGDLVAGPLVEILGKLTIAVGLMGHQIRNMPGADRGSLKEVDAMLVEVGKELGVFPADTPVERPKSAWPEGAGVINSHAPGVRQGDDDGS